MTTASMIQGTGYMPLKEAFGGNVPLPTLHRWARLGCRGHVLRTVRLGGRVMTKAEWCLEWLTLTNQPIGDGAMAQAATA